MQLPLFWSTWSLARAHVLARRIGTGRGYGYCIASELTDLKLGLHFSLDCRYPKNNKLVLYSKFYVALQQLITEQLPNTFHNNSELLPHFWNEIFKPNFKAQTCQTVPVTVIKTFKYDFVFKFCSSPYFLLFAIDGTKKGKGLVRNTYSFRVCLQR